KSRKLGRSVERESNRNPTPVLEDDSEEEEGAAPDLSGLSGDGAIFSSVLAAVQAMGSTLGKHMKALEKKFDDGMRKVNARIDRLSIEEVAVLDEEHKELLSFANALDKRVFTIQERRMSIKDRDQSKWTWMKNVRS
ncbi:hypothetical protein PMAYCL1PPCAC_15060, partial [Pristionchus mayeri]